MRLLLGVSFPEKRTPWRRKGRTADSAAGRDIDTLLLLWSILGVLRVLMASFMDARVPEDQEPWSSDFPSLRFSTWAPNYQLSVKQISVKRLTLWFWHYSGKVAASTEGNGYHLLSSCQEELWFRQGKSQKSFLVLAGCRTDVVSSLASSHGVHFLPGSIDQSCVFLHCFIRCCLFIIYPPKMTGIGSTFSPWLFHKAGKITTSSS